MNKFTEAVWEVIDEALDDDETLLSDLREIMRKEYKPFLKPEQALQVNIHQLQTYVLDKVHQLIDWLPDTTINDLFSELAQEALKEVYWSYLAGMLQERLASIVS